VAIAVDDIVNMINTREIVIGNPRPDHDRVGTKLRYRKTAQRVKDWADDLLRNEAVLGNLTWNLQDGSTYELEERDTGELRLHLLSGGFATDIDSASRMRAIEMASKAALMTMDPTTRISVRIFPFEQGKETEKLFYIYNQVGEKVSNTVAKSTYQKTPLQRVARQLVLSSPHLGMDNVEQKFDVVSKNSTKLVSFGTLSGALESSWTVEPFDEKEEAEVAQYLVDFWNALVTYLPDLGRVSLARRQATRGRSMVATAVAMHGYFAVADKLHREGSTDFTVLEALRDKMVMPVDGLAHKQGELIDWLDYDNPEWLRRGVLVQATDKKGVVKHTLRMSFQTRKSMGDAMIEKINEL